MERETGTSGVITGHVLREEDLGPCLGEALRIQEEEVRHDPCREVELHSLEEVLLFPFREEEGRHNQGEGRHSREEGHPCQGEGHGPYQEEEHRSPEEEDRHTLEEDLPFLEEPCPCLEEEPHSLEEDLPFLGEDHLDQEEHQQGKTLALRILVEVLPFLVLLWAALQREMALRFLALPLRVLLASLRWGS